MYNSVIFVVLYCSVIDLKNAGCAFGYSCYKFDASLWTHGNSIADQTNGLCENYCKDADVNYAYSGTIYKECYCRETEPLMIDNVDDDKCTYKCSGDNEDICGGLVENHYHLITVSKIASLRTDCLENPNDVWSYTGTTSVTHTGKTCQRWDTDYPHLRIYKLGSQHHNYCRNPSNYHKLWCYTLDENTRWESCDIPQCEQTTKAVTVQSTLATSASATAITIRDTTTADFNGMLNDETSPATVTQKSPDTVREITSSISENVNYVTSTAMTETSTPAETEQTTEAVTMRNTRTTSASTSSIGNTTTADFNGMLTSDSSLGAVTQSTPDNVSEISSSTSENVNSAISTVTTEISTPSRTEQTADAVTVQIQATTATSITIGDTTTADFNDNTFPATVIQSSPDTVREISSSTSENVYSVSSTILTKPSTSARTVKRPKKLLCECPKKFCNTKWHFLDGSDITDSEVMKLVLEDFYQNILSEISIDKKSVTKEVRKRNSAINKTKSSKFIGWGSIVFLILPMAIVIAIDLLNCCFHFQKRSRRSKHDKRDRINAISKDRDIPLQENVPSTDDYYATRCGNNFHPDEIKRETYQKRRVDPC